MNRKRIVNVNVLADHKVSIRFNDGVEKEIDLEPFLNGAVFEPIQNDRKAFEDIQLEGGTIAWQNGADIDPYVLYYGGIKEAEEKMVRQVSIK